MYQWEKPHIAKRTTRDTEPTQETPIGNDIDFVRMFALDSLELVLVPAIVGHAQHDSDPVVILRTNAY